jgi:hypothetical protein
MVQKMGVAIMKLLRCAAVFLVLGACAAHAQRTGRILVSASRAVATSNGIVLTLIITNDNSYRVRLALAAHPRAVTSTGHALGTMDVSGIYESPTMVDAGNAITVIVNFHHRPSAAFCSLDVAMPILVLQEHQVQERITLGLTDIPIRC